MRQTLTVWLSCLREKKESFAVDVDIHPNVCGSQIITDAVEEKLRYFGIETCEWKLAMDFACSSIIFEYDTDRRTMAAIDLEFLVDYWQSYPKKEVSV